jgi:Flavodoxin reductases (ferredoxin-NADPH reductases) family 1
MNSSVLEHGGDVGVSRPMGLDAPELRRRTGTLRRNRAVVTLIGWALMVMPAVLFLAESGLGRFANLGSSLVAVGIIAGLVATTALLLMLLLSARVPLIDHALGQPAATSLHTKLGNWVVGGLGVHAVFVVVGDALLDGTDVISEFVLQWGWYVDFILAVAGMGLLLVVIVSSIAAARRRLPYEVWHVIHLLSYAAVGLSIPHMFSMSGLLAEGAWQRVYWIALLSATGAALLVFRFLRPMVSSLIHQVRVVAVVPEGDDAVTIEFGGRNLERLGARAGQYFHWRFLTPDLWWHQHPLSLSAAPRPDRLRVTVRSLGKGTRALLQLRPGVRVLFEGPYGSFTDQARTQPGITLIGAGIGITPIRALLEEASFAPGQARVILRASAPAQLYLHHEVEDLCRTRGARLTTLVGHRAGDRWVPVGREDLGLVELVPELVRTDVFVCGPKGFVRSVTEEALAAGVPQAQLHVEEFAW